MITITSSGSFENTEKFLSRMSRRDIFRILDHFGAEGVNALAAATPTETGKTASSWYYEIKQERGTYSIIWGNHNVVDGRPIAVLLQYGHGTRTGGYVRGRDYINPAIRPIFDRIAAEAWRVVTQ